MEDIERIKERLDNIESIKPIVGALKTIAASGWRMALKRLMAARDYARQIEEMLAVVIPYLPSPLPFYRAARGVRSIGAVVITSERGLCGGFNVPVLQVASDFIAAERRKGNRVDLIVLGRRGEMYFSDCGEDILLFRPLPVARLVPYLHVEEVSRKLLQMYHEGSLDEVSVIYNAYIDQGRYTPLVERLLPPALPSGQREGWPEPIVETEAEVLFRHLVAELVSVRLYIFVLESTAGEQAARFRAMESASDNAQKLIEELTLMYHSARQHAITMEMLDLATGVEALKRRVRRSL